MAGKIFRRGMIWGGGALLASFVSPALAQGCFKPAPPPLPDKSNLDAASRNAATAQIDAYLGAMNHYLACLEQSDSVARAEAERIIQSWEKPVTDIQVVTD
jgi:hypothetical protein